MARPALLERLVPSSPIVLRRLAVAAVVAQAGIAVTGSVVRVTASGLGCPTWPRCFPDSLVPTPHPAVAALHQWVEFGNRLLSVAVVLVTALCFLAALGTRPRRPRLVRLALVQPLGVVAQAVIGGFTVLLGLAWWSVSVHFLVSMALVWLAVQLVRACSESDEPARSLLPPPIRRLVAASTGVLALLLTAGTFVTAAGPHSGDAATPRLPAGVPAMAQLHADLLCGYLGLLVGLGFALHAVAAPPSLLWRFRVLVVAVVAQGVLGGVQYALGVPEALVSLHVLGAALVTVAAAALWAATARRPPVDAPEPADAPDPRRPHRYWQNWQNGADMRAVQVTATGGPEVLEPAELPDPEPGPGELLVEVAAAGVNFIDTYKRRGLYPVDPPFVPGEEGVGRVTALGPGDTGDIAVGDRVVWANVAGSYAERVVVPADRAVPVPDGIADDVAVGAFLQGMTAHFLVTDCAPVDAGDPVLVHAAAGGVGLLLTQLATARGARVLATVSTAEKEKLARDAGAAEVLPADHDDLAAAVRELTGGDGVVVAFDGVGAATFDASLASLRRRGTLVLYGASSGPVPPVDPMRLNRAGSVYLTRPTLHDFVVTRRELLDRATAVFTAVRDGRLHVRIGHRYPLDRAADAHTDLQGRRTTGKVLLIP